MQATLCDNCKKPSGDDEEYGMEGWVLMSQLVRHPGGPHETDNPMEQMFMAKAGGDSPPHLCGGKRLEFCSPGCVVEYIQAKVNGPSEDPTPDGDGDGGGSAVDPTPARQPRPNQAPVLLRPPVASTPMAPAASGPTNPAGYL